MAIAAVLAVTLDPALRMLFARMDPFAFRPRFLARIASALVVGTYRSEERHPVSRLLFRVYEPVCRLVLDWPKTTIALALILVASTVPAYLSLGSELFPPLDEGTLLYMPTTLPGISVAEAERLLRETDRILRDTPEVVRVFGKAGRAESATDPAPLSMLETTVLLKPRSEWRHAPRFYSGWPDFLKPPLRAIAPERIREEDLVAELDAKLRLPGVSNAWTMPIKNRVDMLHTGIRTPIGVKIFGPDLATIDRVGASVEAALRTLPRTRSIFAERTTGGYFLDFDLKRAELARHGLSVEDAASTLLAAVGGETVTTTVEGRERYTVAVRYPRELRDSVATLERVLASTPSGAQVPLAQIASIRTSTGPAMIRNENGLLAGYVYLDIEGSDVGGYVAEARKVVAARVALPQGTTIVWSGEYENMVLTAERLWTIVPVTVLLILVLLYLNTRSWVKVGIVFSAVFFSLVGAIWLLYFLGYHMSVAVWVGMIALMGLDAETGIFMLLFLDLSYAEADREGRLRSRADLREAIVHGAVKRIRPKMMTVTAAILGLLPMLLSQGTGADMMKRVAAPMVGGLVTSFLLELLVYPPVYEMWKVATNRARFRE
jgi:Cu(I)/Ag(I) efflux system membrane protein CusA/SilA